MKAKGYDYTGLNEIQQKIGDLVNIYAVVKEFEGPFSAASGFKMDLKLVDESLQGAAGAAGRHVRAAIFAASQREMPMILAQGDIIRMHRVRVKVYKNDLELNGSIGQIGFHCVTFDGDLGASIDPRASTSHSYTMADFDRQKV